jgi:hypothetical protein
VTGIRASERHDLRSVCELYEAVARSGVTTAPPPLLGYFERTFFDHPWVDPAVPSLVYEDRDGRIVGFLGSHVRHLRVDGRRVRLACSGQLVADPGTAHRGVGALLMRRYLGGPQDLTITDGATDTVRRMWIGLGGHALAHASVGWTRVLHPGAAVAAALAETRGRPGLHRVVRVLTPAIDTLAGVSPGTRSAFGIADPTTTREELTAEALVAQLNDAARVLRMYPDYDVPFLNWLFRELDAVSVRGRSVRRLVRSENGRVAGWYIYFLARRGIAQVIQIAAAQGGDLGVVLDDLLAHAKRGGAAAVRGRIEPALQAVLPGRRCILSRTDWALVHSREPAVLALLGSADALLTRLEGEWWMGHHLLWRVASSTGRAACAEISDAPHGRPA